MTILPPLVQGVAFLDWAMILISLFVAMFGAIIFLQDTRKPNSQGFFFLALSVGIWGIVGGLLRTSVFAGFIPTFIAVSFIVGALIPTIAVLFLRIIVEEENLFTSRYAKMLFLPYVFVVIGLLTKDLVFVYQEASGGTGGQIFLGKGYMLYVAYLALCWIFMLTFLVRAYYRNIALQTSALIASVVFGTTIIIGMVLAPIFYQTASEVFSVGQVVMILYFAIVGTLVAKKNDWNLKLVTTQFVVSLVIIMLSIELFFATSIADLVAKVVIMFAVLFASSFLEKSILRETESQEKIEQLLDKLAEMNQSLKTLDRKKSEFLVIAAHHLRDPLTIINGYASMLLEGSFGDISVELKVAMAKIFESGKRLVTMISDFMDISHIESGNMRYDFADVDIKKLVSELGADMKLSAERAGLGFEVLVHVPADEPFIAVADYGKLRQVASNLMDNAIKYTPKGMVAVHLSKSLDNKQIILSITDTGIGMSKATLEKIFKKFSRAEGVSKVYTEGSGLGLYVAKEIMKKHGGKIWAESAGDGYGATFFIELAAKG